MTDNKDSLVEATHADTGLNDNDATARNYDPAVDGPLLNKRQTAAMCGDPSDMSLWRWRQLEDDPFPDPIDICGRNYWPRSWIFDWLRRRACATAPNKSVPLPPNASQRRNAI